MSREVEFKETAPCDLCGRFGAFEFEGRKLCSNCYESCGSCCPEFGRETENGMTQNSKTN
jgi:hypothetical protein